MKKSCRPFLKLLAVILSMTLGRCLWASPQEETIDQKIKYGEYLTRNVAMCIECHTPRNEEGELLRNRLFEGAPIPVGKPPWVKSWALRSKNIAGLTGWSAEEGIHFLETGIRPDGTRPELPMPPFRMQRREAEAIILYLKNMPRD